MERWVPGPHEIVREALVLLAGYVLAAWIIGRVPKLRELMAAGPTLGATGSANTNAGG